MEERQEYYVIRDRVPVPATYEEFHAWRRTRSVDLSSWKVGYDKDGDRYSVSTVFIGYDDAFHGAPEIFETLVGANTAEGFEQWQVRCSTWGEAERQHATELERAKGMAA